jgi:hypothetical protein
MGKWEMGNGNEEMGKWGNGEMGKVSILVLILN